MRLVSALKENGHTVGFLGDGVNDIPALNEANVGISVDTAVDAAKDAADVVLLQKDLNVLEQGVLEGRKTFTNMLKYIKIIGRKYFLLSIRKKQGSIYRLLVSLFYKVKVLNN